MKKFKISNNLVVLGVFIFAILFIILIKVLFM
jgi:hypothetical protein